MLEELFGASVDCQCGDNLSAATLNYITGYCSKASDSLCWKSKEWSSDVNSAKWLQCYRLLCKRAPLVPEMVLGFTSKPMMVHTFNTDFLYAPLPYYVEKKDGTWLIDGVKPIFGGESVVPHQTRLDKTREQTRPDQARPSHDYSRPDERRA